MCKGNMLLRLSLLLLYIFGASAQTLQAPVVSIDQGTVVGSNATDGDYFVFHGIPYADSTSGKNRFKAPSPPPSFQSDFIANRNDIKCVRPLGLGYEGTEDCLVANVFTPTLNNTARLPVMVWIKGREFDTVGGRNLSFSNFVNSGVIIVSLNFRESIFGFLCLGTETAPGNAGLKDIIAGLRWVKTNIAQFGGDPDNVSLFGHGSGAAAIDLVSLSPIANGLVSKVIAQSGTALSPWAVTRDNLRYAIEVAEGLGHTITSIESLSDAFERTSVAALMAIINELDLTNNALAFAPCIERDDLENVEPFLTKSPLKILAEGDYPPIPFMTGFVDLEGTIRAEEAFEHDWLEKMEESFAEFVQSDLDLKINDEGSQAMEDIRSFYFGEQIINEKQIENFISYHGDTMILVAALREARLRANTSSSPIYLYQFSYKGTLGELFVGPVVVNSSAHSEELAYLFYHEADVTPSKMDMTVSDILVDRWTNFAKFGVPETEISQVLWKPYTNVNASYLRILDAEEINVDQGGSLEEDLENPHPETLLFWDDIYSKFFVDAAGKWDLENQPEEEVDEDDEIIVVDGSEEAEESEDTDGEDEDEDKDDEDGGNSASRIVGYTFLIIPFYYILSEFHMFQIVS